MRVTVLCALLLPAACSATSAPSPSAPSLCVELPATSTFVSIADEPGVVAGLLFDDRVETVTLPFAFPWVLGATSTIGVSSDGQINLDGSTDSNCCSPDPVDAASYPGDRIAFAQEDLNPSRAGAIYFLDKSTSFVVSFEGIPFFDDMTFSSLNVQVELYDDGAIEIRWGDGDVPREKQFAAGVESAAVGLAFPVTSKTSPVFDGALPGVSRSSFGGAWPTGRGVRFECAFTGAPSASPAPTLAPSTTLSPSTPAPTPAPSTLDELCVELPATHTFMPITGEPGAVEFFLPDDGVETLTLPFAFPWFTGATSTIGVSSNGQINLDGSTDSNCCDADWIDAASYPGDRIAFAQDDLDPSHPSAGRTLFLDKSTSFVVSFEAIPFWFEYRDSSIHVQVELYDDGAIEIRYGRGFLPSTEQFAAGIESAAVGLAFPVTSKTSPVFDSFAPGISGVGEWPTGRGVRFECSFTGAPTYETAAPTYETAKPTA